MGHSSTSVEPEEKVVGASELHCIGWKPRWQDFQLASEVQGQGSLVWDLKLLHVDIVRIEVIAWWYEKNQLILKYQSNKVWSFNVIWAIVKG